MSLRSLRRLASWVVRRSRSPARLRGPQTALATGAPHDGRAVPRLDLAKVSLAMWQPDPNGRVDPDYLPPAFDPPEPGSVRHSILFDPYGRPVSAARAAHRQNGVRP